MPVQISDIARHPEARRHDAIGIFRPSEPLFFFNAESNLARVQALCAANPKLRAAILSLEESADMDSTALDALIEFERAFQAGGRTLYLARLKDDARAGLVKAGAAALTGPDRCFWSVWDAYRAATSDLSTTGRPS